MAEAWFAAHRGTLAQLERQVWTLLCGEQSSAEAFGALEGPAVCV